MFGVTDLARRLLHGGFPEMLLAPSPNPAFFEEWLDITNLARQVGISRPVAARLPGRALPIWVY